MADVTGTFYASDADIGYGTELLVGQDDGSPETFVALKECKSIKLGKLTAPRVDKTHLRSIGRAREYTTGMRDYENIAVVCNWDPTHGSQSNAGGDGFTAGGMLALHRSQETRNFMALIGTASPQEQWDFRGRVSGYDPPSIDTDNLMSVTFEITPVEDYTASLP